MKRCFLFFKPTTNHPNCSITTKKVFKMFEIYSLYWSDAFCCNPRNVESSSVSADTSETWRDIQCHTLITSLLLHSWNILKTMMIEHILKKVFEMPSLFMHTWVHQKIIRDSCWHQCNNEKCSEWLTFIKQVLYASIILFFKKNSQWFIPWISNAIKYLK